MTTAGSRVRLQELKRTITCRPGETLLQSAQRLDVELATACGGTGKCKTCLVRICEGDAGDPSADDRLTARQAEEGWRRACLFVPRGDCKVHVPTRALAAGKHKTVLSPDIAPLPVDAMIRRRNIVFETSPDDGLAQLTKVLKQAHGESGLTIDPDVRRTAGTQLQTAGRSLDAIIRGDTIIALRPAGQPLLGIAVDLGTTTVAAFLCDLETGKTLAAIEGPNPQNRFGADIVSRLAVAIRSDGHQRQLRAVIASGLNRLISELCALAGTDVRGIVDMVIAGNTAMHHLLLGLPIRQLAKAPFVPATSSALAVPARDGDLEICPGGKIYYPAIVAGYVGSDHTAALLGAELAEPNPHETVLLVDIGTNTEISLLHRGNLASASCPSGPALEGGEISCGMRAVDGAVHKVRLCDRRVELETIGGLRPAGLCGSAVLDTLAGLWEHKVINARGRLDKTHPLVRTLNDRRELVLFEPDDIDEEDITFSQEDIRPVQLAKSAIRTGIDLLLEQQGAEEGDLDRIIIAGAFGRHIDIASAIKIGLLPDLPLGRFTQIGNAAGEGARRMLLSASARRQAEAMVEGAQYLELSGHRDFMRRFITRINFE